MTTEEQNDVRRDMADEATLAYIAKLEAQVAALREDKARLDAVIENQWVLVEGGGSWQVRYERCHQEGEGPTARAAIDDARRSKGGAR